MQEKVNFFPATHQGKLVILIHYSFIMTSIIHESVSISTSYHSLLTKAWFLSINCKYLYKYRSDSVGSIFCSWIRLRVRGTISPGVEPILLVSLSLVRIRIGGKVGSWSDNNIKGCIIGDIPAWTICLFAQNWTNYIIITLYLV